MSNVNGNNIDDLFKRASDQYPLRTNSADWDKLAADLEKDPSLILPPLNEEEGKRKRRRFFWLFLLLPLGGAGYYAWHSTTESHRTTLVKTETNKHADNDKQADNDKKADKDQSKDPVIQSETAKKIEDEGKNKNIRNDQGYVDKATGKEGVVAREGSAGREGPAGRKRASGNNGSAGREKVSGNEGPGSTGKERSANNGSINEGSAGITSVNKLQTREKFIRVRSSHNRPAQEKRKGYGDQGGDRITTIGAGSAQAAGLTRAATYEAPGSKLTVQRANTAEKVSLNVSVKNNRPEGPIPDSGTARPKKNNARKSYFYAGVLVAPDLSLVKFQSVKGVGTTFGVLLGYNLNKRWAIESGLYVERKKYYTDGQFFNLKNPNMLPSGSSLVDVNGVCNMLELPINVRYNLGEGPKMHWFATGGFSTYFMSSENYAYKYQFSPGGTTWDRSWMFKKPSQFWFSEFNLSLGYEQRLGKIGDLRLEPYLRVPLSGIGTGSLPIMSAGLNIGITRKFR